jgi:hypothetical protein
MKWRLTRTRPLNVCRTDQGDDLSGATCRVLKLNVTMSEPRYRDNDHETDKAVDVMVPDDAGHIVELE